MKRDSGFDGKEFTEKPYLKLIEDKEGATCLCYQMRLHGKLHFVKKIKPEFINDARMRAAFRKENEIGFSLSHPNIPRYVFMGGIFSSEEYVVTEWIEGVSLDKFIENNPKYFSFRKNINKFIYQLTDALDYMHQNGIIHGDLKPSNILLSRDGERAILLDLGYSISDSHTLTGGYTYDFAAPELIKGESATEAADYFSLGKIIEFIENHTDGKMPKEILALKKAFTNSNKSERIQTKEETERIVEKKRGQWIWLTGLTFLGLIVWFIIATVNKDSSTPNTPTNINNTDFNHQPVSNEEIENNNDRSFSSDIEVFQTEEPNSLKNDNKVPPEKNEISRVNIETEKEKIKEEVNRLLKVNYTPLMDRIDSLTRENDFTRDWYFKIVNESAEAMNKSIRDGYYYEKYPTVPRDEVNYILSNEFKDFCDSIWLTKLKNYQKNIPR